MAVYVAEVSPRWSDIDAYGHINHANTVTLLEETSGGPRWLTEAERVFLSLWTAEHEDLSTA